MTVCITDTTQNVITYFYLFDLFCGLCCISVQRQFEFYFVNSNFEIIKNYVNTFLYNCTQKLSIDIFSVFNI